MPTEFTINQEHGLVISRGTGVFTREDYLDHMSRVKADPRFSPDFNQLVDCRAISKMDLSGMQIRDIASRTVFDVRSRRAFVVSSEVHFTMTCVFGTFRQINAGQEVGVFREWHEACSWLGLPPEFHLTF